MQISGPGLPSLLRLEIAPQALRNLPLQDGEHIAATVRGSDGAGQLTLEINGRLLQVISSLRLTAGMTLQLRVEKSNEQLLLHLDDKTLQQLTHHQAVRHSLPAQEPLKPLIETLQRLLGSSAGTPPSAARGQASLSASLATVTNTAGTTTPPAAAGDKAAPHGTGDKASAGSEAPAKPGAAPVMPRPVVQAVERLLAVLPALAQVTTAEGLKQAVASSGLFLENALLHARQVNATDKDVKTALLRLANAIRQSLASEGSGTQSDAQAGRETLQSLLRQVDSGLARLQLHQLASLGSQQAQGDERQVITLELPLLQPQDKSIETLQLKIQREKNRNGSGAQDCWSVTLHLTPSGYGDIHAVVSLTGGKVSTTFWCQEEHTGELFRQRLAELHARLDEQGLQVGRCSAITGTPPEGVSTEPARDRSGLIDTRA